MRKIQPSFNSGEWAPSLFARVDLKQYLSGAALLRNFIVDYRGGATTRPGTKYVIQAWKSSTAVCLIPFQASFAASYVLEFGDYYIRFHRNGSPVLETGISITAATKASPCYVSATNTFSDGQWVYISDVSGMTQLNGRYFEVRNTSGAGFDLYDLRGNAVNSSSYSTYTSGGTAQRVYTITSPYSAAQVLDIKYAQDVADLILCHPEVTPYVLTFETETSWLISPIVFGSSLSAPTGVSVATTLAVGTTNYSYIVTAVDINGQESPASSATALASKTDLRTVAGTNTVSWSAVAGASSYNVYKSEVSITNAVPAGVPHGFIGNVTSLSINDSNISPDFSIGPPVVRNPFAAGAPVVSGTVTAGGSYTSTPTISFSAPAAGITALGYPVFGAVSVTVSAGGGSYAVNDILTAGNGLTLRVTSIGPGGATAVTGLTIVTPGSFTTIPTNPVSLTGGSGSGCTANFTWAATSIGILNGGSGYLTAPTITFSAGAATATATIGDLSSGFPAVPSFYQQRLFLSGLTSNPQTMYFSQTGAKYNFNVTSPVVDTDAITAALSSGQINNIRSVISQPAGLMIFTDSANWLVNGGAAGVAVTPSSIVATPQSYDGSSDLPPIIANANVLFVGAKGTTVRDCTYNFYTNVYAGTDISIQSSHLFFGYNLVSWCWSQEPFKLVWAVRDDGVMLTLTYIKDQEFIAWSHSDTDGDYKSVCSIVEPQGAGYINAVYCLVERTVDSTTVQYVERFDNRTYTTAADAWCVDAGVGYDGSPATTFSGGEHLAGKTVQGLADGAVIPSFVMPASGTFTVSAAASKVTVGLGFTAQLQTLPLEVPVNETIQGKPKKIASVVVRVAAALGLKIGASFSRLVTMKDLVVGNVGSMLVGQETQVVSDLFTGDTRTILDPSYTVPGQYCIQQDQPLPATILGVIPEFSMEVKRG